MTGPGQGGSRRGGTRHRLALGCALSLLTLTGCATGGGAAGQSSPTPRSDLAGQAEVAAKNLRKPPAGTRVKQGEKAGRAKVKTAGGQSEKPGSPAEPVGTTEAAAPAGTPVTWQPVRLAADARRDHGNGPAYADLTSLTVEDGGTDLRVTVELGGTIPGALGDGEVQGVGVDLFRLSRDESDFQVFLDGGTHGWRAFLQTPRGFVEFPGALAVDGRTLVAVLPWASIGGRQDAQVSAFSDWSDGRGGTSVDAVERGPMPVG